MSVIRITQVCAGLALLVAAPLASQTRSTPSPAALRRAVETITEADFAAKLGALAHDSTRGRETPSPELERATDWVAAQFRRIGLRPAGDSGGYLQRFQLLNARIDSLSTVSASGPGFSATWALGGEIVYAVGRQPVDVRALPVVLMAGIPSDTLRPFGDVSVRGAAILHVIAADQFSPRALNPVAGRAQAEGALLHIVVFEVPASQWVQFVRRSFPQRWEVAGGAGDARPTAVYALQQANVANVIGVIEGSDRALRDEAVVFTGHMDHVGVVGGGRCQPSSALPADSICNGADDNASGTVGVIELAEAFAALRPRPARTLVFAAVTAEERGLYGSRFYVDHPVIPLDRTAAVINLDMIARNPRDTVGLVEKDYTSLGGVVDRLARENPELRLAPKAHPGVYQASDHFPFAQRGVPALFFFSGIHPDLHEAADNVDRADAEQAARIVRLAFLVGLEVANTVARPTWDPAARARIVGAGGN